MATDLVGNEKLQRFIRLLSDLNHLTAQAYASGKIEIFKKMNGVILEMYEIQHDGKEDAYTAIDEDCKMIYENFNAIIAMLKSSENIEKDEAASVAVKKFLQNIFDANVRIVHVYGLA